MRGQEVLYMIQVRTNLISLSLIPNMWSEQPTSRVQSFTYNQSQTTNSISWCIVHSIRYGIWIPNLLDIPQYFKEFIHSLKLHNLNLYSLGDPARYKNECMWNANLEVFSHLLAIDFSWQNVNWMEKRKSTSNYIYTL